MESLSGIELQRAADLSRAVSNLLICCLSDSSIFSVKCGKKLI